MHDTKSSYGNKLKSMIVEIGLIYTTKSKKTRLAGSLLKCSITAEIGLIYTTKSKKTRLAGYLLKRKTW